MYVCVCVLCVFCVCFVCVFVCICVFVCVCVQYMKYEKLDITYMIEI